LYLNGNNVDLLTDILTDLNQSAATGTLALFFAQLNDVAYAG
jgi:hypothetical protein